MLWSPRIRAALTAGTSWPTALKHGIIPVVCIGEVLAEREADLTAEVLLAQLKGALAGIHASAAHSLVIAYEPVWAISTFEGELAKPSDVQIELDFIRSQIAELYGHKAAQTVRVLYGGSVDDQIASGYLELNGCDGALVGGASLDPTSFAKIVATAP